MASAKCNNQCPTEIYLTAAFRSVRPNEYYIFMKKEGALYLVEYAPMAVKQERLLRSPTPIDDLFPSLGCTIFADAGIDCAFASNSPNKAFIFSYDQCAEFDYAPYGGRDRIVRGPMPITSMFPCLKNTEFESEIDAAFDVSDKKRAYLIKNDKCVCIGIDSANPYVVTQGRVRDMFPVLRGTIFENGGWDAAFGFNWGTWKNTANLSKGDTMANMHFNTLSAQPQAKWGPHKYNSVQPNLGRILPRKNLIAN